ncbi:MAG: hypothetical protein EOM10_08635 [Opitutae bacterium]|nr:hypothetical protein [Opitutae bacterium]
MSRRGAKSRLENLIAALDAPSRWGGEKCGLNPTFPVSRQALKRRFGVAISGFALSFHHDIRPTQPFDLAQVALKQRRPVVWILAQGVRFPRHIGGTQQIDMTFLAFHGRKNLPPFLVRIITHFGPFRSLLIVL